jgi:adenylate kinase family enzyme
MNRIFITGGIGSGKTYSAAYLSERYCYQNVSLDELFFNFNSIIHRERKSVESRNNELNNKLKEDKLIFEGWNWGEWLIPMYKCLNLVLIIDTPEDIRVERIIKRYTLRKAGNEYDPYPNSDPNHLNNLIKWTKLWNKEVIVNEIKKDCPKDCDFIDGITDIKDFDLSNYFH